MNKKRDTELAKLRKLLEDVHLESEETAHQLRTKHQAAIAEMQDQLDLVQKSKNKYKKVIKINHSLIKQTFLELKRKNKSSKLKFLNF